MQLLFQIGFLEIRFGDIVDIALVSGLLFHLYKLVRGTVALRILLGFLVLYITYLTVKAMQMELLTSILGQFMGLGVLAGIILFQPEIRKLLLFIGQSTSLREIPFMDMFKKHDLHQHELDELPIIEALAEFAETQTGALIVVSKEASLDNFVATGDVLDATISKRLLISIFNKFSPLHDGGVLIIKGKIKAARSILPVSENMNIPASMGLRHRAGIGMSEITDTLILICSEQTGAISTVRNGVIQYDLNAEQVRRQIDDYYLSGTENKTK